MQATWVWFGAAVGVAAEHRGEVMAQAQRIQHTVGGALRLVGEDGQPASSGSEGLERRHDAVVGPGVHCQALVVDAEERRERLLRIDVEARARQDSRDQRTRPFAYHGDNVGNGKRGRRVSRQ